MKNTIISATVAVFALLFVSSVSAGECMGGPCDSLFAGQEVGYTGSNWTGANANGAGNSVSDTFTANMTNFTSLVETMKTVSSNPDCLDCKDSFERFEVEGIQTFNAGAKNQSDDTSHVDMNAEGNTHTYGQGERVGFATDTLYRANTTGDSIADGHGTETLGQAWTITEASGQIDTLLVRRASLVGGCASDQDCASNFQQVTGNLNLRTGSGASHEATGPSASSLADTSVTGNTMFTGHSDWSLKH